MAETCARTCPDCEGALTRPESWDPWTCGKCDAQWVTCPKCDSFTREYAYGRPERHGLEDCMAALGRRLTRIEEAARHG